MFIPECEAVRQRLGRLQKAVSAPPMAMNAPPEAMAKASNPRKGKRARPGGDSDATAAPGAGHGEVSVSLGEAWRLAQGLRGVEQAILTEALRALEAASTEGLKALA